MKKISILIPCYNEEENVVPISEAVINELKKSLQEYDYEILFIDNDSKDNTRPLLREICRKNPKIKAIFNAKNFGQFNSPYYGMLQTTGDCTICMCCDFQDPIEMIPKLVHEWENGYKIVCAIKTTSKENKIIRFLRTCYYKLIKKMSDVEQIEHFTGFGLYDKSFIEVLRNLKDPTPFLRGIVAELGYRRKDIPYEQAKVTVKEALQVMGEEYCKALAHGMESGWIDVYENKGKRGGAYSWGSYGVHPFVLLNHNDTINSMFTLAHEMGHALHSFFTWKKQPYLYADHKIFVAEVASTCNEALLMEHLLKTTEDKTMRKYLINYFLEQFRTTLYRQTMFAEFEKLAHAQQESGGQLTADWLCETYYTLNKKYFGEDMVVDEEIAMEWARIPHFYTPFYVYQYATGFSAAIALSGRIFYRRKCLLCIDFCWKTGFNIIVTIT